MTEGKQGEQLVTFDELWSRIDRAVRKAGSLPDEEYSLDEKVEAYTALRECRGVFNIGLKALEGAMRKQKEDEAKAQAPRANPAAAAHPGAPIGGDAGDVAADVEKMVNDGKAAETEAESQGETP